MMITLETCKRCLVVGCKRASETDVDAGYERQPDIPVCLFHYSRNCGGTRAHLLPGTRRGMSFAMTQEWRSRLLHPRLVREDVFVQGLTQDEVEMIREALGKGLTPNGFDVAGNAVILRFDRNESRKPLQDE